MDKGRDLNGLLNCNGRCVGAEAYHPYRSESVTRTTLPVVPSPAAQPRPNRLLSLFRQLITQRDSLKDQSAWSNGNT
jgi:hypothetical protein